MFRFSKPLPIIIALVTLHTFNNLTLQLNCYNVVHAVQQPTNATIDDESNGGSATTTIGQICSTRRLKNASLCKPCICDPMGSESPNCDQLTRRCSCKLGYMGNNCNKCSYGFLNSTTRLDLKTAGNSNASSDWWQCKTCGPCFDSWQESLSPLKGRAIGLIKRASDLNGMFLDHLDLDPTTNKLVLSNNGTSLLDKLDTTLQTIGEKILENKQASDRINLLSNEFNSTVISINETHSEVADQTLECKQIETKLENLNYGISLQSDIQQHFTKSLEVYKEELLDVQEFIPDGAIRLIKSYRNRTRKTLARILEHDREFAPILNSSLANLEQMLDKVKYSTRQMKYIGSQILNDTLNTHPMAAMDSHHELMDHRHHYSSLQFAHLDGPAREIAELDMQLFDNYQANYENRTSEMSETRRQIEAAKGKLLQAGNLMNAFEVNLTAIDQIVSSLNGTSSCDFEQLVENATQIVRASLDKIDVRWPAAQAEFIELASKALFFNDRTSQLFPNLSSELNSALSEKLPNLVAFKQADLELYDLSDITSMKNKTKFLADRLNDLSRKLNKLAELKQVTSDLRNQTKFLNANVTSGQDAMTADATNDISSMLERRNILAQDSKSALERVRNHQSESFGMKLTSDWNLADKIDKLTNSTDENIQLSQQLSDRVAELSSGLLIVNGLANMTSAADVKNSTRLIKLHDKRRLTNIMNDLRYISLRLHRGLMQSQNLSVEFDDFERKFARQTEIIDFLHREIDSINIDLKRKSTYYQDCQTS